MLKTEKYCITPENLAGHELIGLKARVVRASDRNKVGVRGRIVDETRNVLVIEQGGAEKRIPKNEAVFAMEIGRETREVDGKGLVARPEDRVKLFFKRKGM